MLFDNVINLPNTDNDVKYNFSNLSTFFYYCVKYFKEKYNIELNKTNYLGCGIHGEVYLLDDGTVLKISSSVGEYIVNKQICENDFDNIFKVYQCGKIKQNNALIGSFTVSEFIYTQNFYPYDININIENIFLTIKQTLDRLGDVSNWVNGLDYFNFLKNERFCSRVYSYLRNVYSDEYADFFIQFRNCYDEIKTLKHSIVDLHSGNVGFSKKDGRFKLFDIMYSKKRNYG